MTHLGERVAALVDGELDHDARDRAVAHLVRCQECRSAVDEQRRLKSRIRELSVTEPSAALLSTLFEIGLPPAAYPAESAGHRQRLESVAAMSLPFRSHLDPRLSAVDLLADRSIAHDRRTTDRRRRAGLVMAGAGSVSAAVLGLSYALGGGASQGPSPEPVAPPVGQFSAEFAGSNDGLPFSDPAVDAYSVSWRTGAGGGHR